MKPIFCQNTVKTGLLESYDQEICGFIDRNAGRDVRVRSEESMRNLGRDSEWCRERYQEGCRDRYREWCRARCIIERSCRVTPDTQLTGNKQTDRRQATDRHQPGTTAGEYAWPAVQSKLRELRRRLTPPTLCPRAADQDFTQQMSFHCRPQKRAPLKTLYINNIDIWGSVKRSTLEHLSIYISDS